MKAMDDQSRIEILVRRPVSTCSAFTLLELLSVIAIMGVLITLLFPAIAAVKESGRKATAGAEVHRIATAVMAFKTEYGKLPTLPKLPKDREGMDLAVGDPAVGMKIPNRELFYTLRAIDAGINADNAVNFRKVVFFEGKNVADPEHPKDGFVSRTKYGNSADSDCYFDPWGIQYCVVLDYSYDGALKLAYGDDAPRISAGAFSLGPDRSLGNSGNGKLKDSDDLASWK